MMQLQKNDDQVSALVAAIEQITPFFGRPDPCLLYSTIQGRMELVEKASFKYVGIHGQVADRRITVLQKKVARQTRELLRAEARIRELEKRLAVGTSPALFVKVWDVDRKRMVTLDAHDYSEYMPHER